jgi:DNA-binding SARP family transcriptional activator
VQVRLLGPVDVVVNGEVRPVPGLRRKALLAALALHCGSIVGTDRLADAVWGDALSPKAVSPEALSPEAVSPKAVSPNVVPTLQRHVSFLREVLGDKAAIVARPPGYLLDLGDEGSDARVAERLFQAGSRADDLACRVRTLRAALALWRGQPLADVAGSPWLERQAERLDLLRLQVKRALYQARLTAGEHGQLIPDLEQLAAGQPLDEGIQAQLMLALYRSGRQADALAVYHRLRRTLDEQLGIDPSRMLRDLETAILRQDPALDAPTPVAAGRLALSG